MLSAIGLITIARISVGIEAAINTDLLKKLS
jgi:hypothetical protein